MAEVFRTCYVLILIPALCACVSGEQDDRITRPPGITDSPSEIERHVTGAAAAGFKNDYEALQHEYAYFKCLDDFLKHKDQKQTGLSDNVLDLLVSNIEDRDDFMEAQRGILQNGADEELRLRVNYRLNDEIKNAESLITADRYNRFAFLFNTFVRPLSLLAVGYFPALIDSTLATALNLDRLTSLSVEEKKALVLYTQFLEKYPDSDKAEILRRRVTCLDKKRIKTSFNKEMAKAREESIKGNFWLAQQRYKNAMAYQPDSEEASLGLKEAREMELKLRELKMESMRPAEMNRLFLESAEETDYRELMYAVATNSPEMTIYEGEDFIAKYPDSELNPFALYAIAAAHDMKGAHERAKALMADLASRYPNTHIGRHAQAYLSHPDYNLYLAFRETEKKHGIQTTKYVLAGEEFAKTNIILGTSRLIMQGLHALQAMGTFNVLGMAIRAVQSRIGNPISEEEIIDSGLKYLRRYPESPLAADIHLAVANAYARRKNLAKAVYHFEASGRVSGKKLAKLRERAARQYLDFAKASDSKDEKIGCYEVILDRYPDTGTSAQALEELALLDKGSKPLFELNKDTIRENPILFKLTELNISPRMLDGRLDNTELSERGLYSTRRGEITVVYRTEGGEKEETFSIEYPAYKRLLAFVDELEYDSLLEQKRSRKLAGNFPVELRGTVGGDGVFVYPRLRIKPYEEKDEYLYK